MDIEIDINKQVLGFDPIPPKRALWDYVPSFIINPIRKFLGWPGPTPREHWHLSLVFVRHALDELIKYYRTSKSPPPLPPKEYVPEGGWN